MGIIGENHRIVKYVLSTRVEHYSQRHSNLFHPQSFTPIKVLNYVCLEKSNVVEIVVARYLDYWL